MLNPETFAVHLARALDLFRTQAPKEEQKQAFRTLVGLLQDGGVLLRVTDGQLFVNGTPVDVPQIVPLRDRLELHAVGELVVPHDAPAGHLYALLKALADLPAMDSTSLAERLRDAGADRVSVSLSAIDMTPLPPRASAPSPARAAPAPEPEEPAELAPEALGTDGLLRGNPMKEYRSTPVAGTSDIVKEEAGRAADDASLPTRGSAEIDESSYDRDAPAKPARPVARRATEPTPAEPPAAPPPLPPPPQLIGAYGVEPTAPPVTQSRTEQALADLAAHPGSPAVLDTLAVLTRQVESAIDADRLEEALRIADAIVVVEARAPEETKRSYAIALKRMFVRSVLEVFAGLAAVARHRDAALRVLARGGDEAVEILLDKLANAPSVDERRSLFAAVSQMKKGQEQLVHLLAHAKWYVVRNVAELLGELGGESAAPALSQQLAHPDERVRAAVAFALAKIGTARAVEPVRRALRDPAGAVRLQVALGVSGRKAGALAMPIVVAIEQEQDMDVTRELMLSLGRIASPDAVQALIKFAQPGGKLFGRKPSGRRLAAVEALRVAATPAAIGTLQGLSDDGDKDVKSAARAALAELKR